MRTRKPNAGYILAVVFFIVFAAGIVAVAFLNLAGSETRAAQQALDSQRAFWLAEAGRNRALGWITRAEEPPQADIRVFSREPGPDGGSYTVDCLIDSVLDAEGELAYRLDSVGESRGIRRRVVQRIQRTSYGHFAYFTDQEIDPAGSPVWHVTGEVVTGPLHTNGLLRVHGSPWFRGLVTSGSGHMIAYPGTEVMGPEEFPIGVNAPLFDEGVRLGARGVPLPATPNFLVAAAQAGGIYTPFEADVELGVMGDGPGLPAAGWFRFRNRPVTLPAWTSVHIASLPQKVFCAGGDVHVKGVLDGELSIASIRDIRIEDDIFYAGSNAGGTPHPGCDDMLGLVAGGDIVFVDNLPNRTDLIVDGILMALGSAIRTENLAPGPPRGVLTLWGSRIQKRCGPIASLGDVGVVVGYRGDIHYDVRVAERMPPCFPLTSFYREVGWKEESCDAGAR